ncbi:hypothetical protein VKT23_002594 [Stygiomarasmius scandens]|uniref:Pheromone receptor n=1 Tax=Marasmiellus scandens TaxID=2682957 RepID=A0ABR1K572_9AGAR
MSGSNSSNAQSFLTTADAAVVNEFITLELLDGILLGVELVLTSSACYLMIRHGLRDSIPRSCLVAAMTVMFICSVLKLTANVIDWEAQINGLAYENYDPLPTLIKWDIIAIITVRISPVLVSGIVDAVFTVRAASKGDFTTTDAAAKRLLPIALLCTNLIATLMIAYKTWEYRHFVKIHLGDADAAGGNHRVEQVLVLLVESGFIYCGLWILIIIGTTPVLSPIANSYVAIVLPHAATIYPTMIVLLTALQKTLCDTTLQGEVYVTQNSIRFASASVPTTSTIQAFGSKPEPVFHQDRAGTNTGYSGDHL